MGERLCPFGQQCVRNGCLDLGLSRGHGVEQARPGYAFEIVRAFLTGVTEGLSPVLPRCPPVVDFTYRYGPLTENYRQNYLTLTSALLSVTGEAVRGQ